jgi:hypothetical protein
VSLKLSLRAANKWLREPTAASALIEKAVEAIEFAKKNTNGRMLMGV